MNQKLEDLIKLTKEVNQIFSKDIQSAMNTDGLASEKFNAMLNMASELRLLVETAQNIKDKYSEINDLDKVGDGTGAFLFEGQNVHEELNGETVEPKQEYSSLEDFLNAKQKQFEENTRKSQQQNDSEQPKNKSFEEFMKEQQKAQQTNGEPNPFDFFGGGADVFGKVNPINVLLDVLSELSSESSEPKKQEKNDLDILSIISKIQKGEKVEISQEELEKLIKKFPNMF